MGWLSKIVLNSVEMLIKDSDARSGLQTLSDRVTQLWNTVYNEIWNGVPGNELTEYYVAPNGDNSNSGTDINHPLASISAAYAKGSYPAAVRNNCFSIIVAGGVYNENVMIGASNRDIQCDIHLMGDVTINGSFSVSNTKCWVFSQYVSEQAVARLRIFGDNSSNNIRGEKIPLCITESAEFNTNAPIYITSYAEINEAIDILYNSVFYSSNLEGVFVSGTFTNGVVKVEHSLARAKFNLLANANAPVSFYAFDSIVQSRDDTEAQTITAYGNIYSGYHLTELT